MKPVEAFLERLHEIGASRRGTPELSYRAALENLLNAVGETLDPQVQATAELADTGAGRPDFGLFEGRSGQLRAVVEVKSPGDDTPEMADARQVARYWQHYGVVLVTNYRDFLLVVRQSDGRPRTEARYTLAATAEGFWRARPRVLAKEHAAGLLDFLAGVLTRSAPIARPKDLAADLARHAREAKRRLAQHDMSALAPLQQALEQALGLHFQGGKGEDFFRSSLVQTLFYGLFSGWMLWRQQRLPSQTGASRTQPQPPRPQKLPSPRAAEPPRQEHLPSPLAGEGPGVRGPFDWKDASEHLALPLIGDLYEEIARPKRLGDLGLREPLEWATASLNRVAEEEFFQRFDAEHAITLFYEPFLEAFDPHLRKELGVWYTPPEIVQYMVGRVDQLLRSELGIADGLADEQVYVLDPACGTGSYLVEVARTIHRTLQEQGHGALAAEGVKKALCTRVFGFEILPAPYVVAHLQLGVLLRSLGARLAQHERCEVYLTNALVGWEPPKEPKTQLLFPELAREAERASRVKREAPILVILGNPPYNRFAGVAEDEEADLIGPYKAGLYEQWGVRKQLLDDLYIRFFRLAEKRIAEASGRGIVCFISNYSWLDGLSHPVMRERLASHFDGVWIDNCNGDKYRTGKRTPDGRPDESMFTTDEHPVGIQVGTAVVTLVKRAVSSPAALRRGPTAEVRYREFWGSANDKRERLVRSLRPGARGVPRYEGVAPRRTLRWVFVNSDLGQPTEYERWPLLADLFPVHFSGLNENRRNAFITVDRAEIRRRMRAYFDADTTLQDLVDVIPGVDAAAAGYDPVQTRKSLLAASALDERRVIPLAFRPFDHWWVYWEARHKLHNRPRPEYFGQVWPGNLFLSASQTARKGGFNQPIVVDKFGDLHLQDPWSQYFPLFTRVTAELAGERVEPNVHRALLERACRTAAVEPNVRGSDGWSKGALAIAERIFFHTLAILWSPAYRRENEAALRQDWPRVPIPAEPDVLEASAALGRQVADLLLPDKRVAGVTTGKLRPELRTLAVPTKVGGGAIDPDRDLRVEAGWGFRGHRNAVMCGKGKVAPHVERAGARGPHPNPLPEGEGTGARVADLALDIYVNDRVYWANVPKDVWAMTIGGYPVVKKWLSYREHKVLGRALRMEEVTYVTEVARRLKAL